MIKTFTLKSYWGNEEFIYIEDFPYTDVSQKDYGDDKVFDGYIARKAQKFTKHMLEKGCCTQTFSFQQMIDWCNEN